MLDSLKDSINKQNVRIVIDRNKDSAIRSGSKHTSKAVVARNISVASNVVDILFDNVLDCIEEDRSATKLNAFERSLIQGLLKNKVRTGIKDYIVNMHPEYVSKLLSDMQRELDRKA